MVLQNMRTASRVETDPDGSVLIFRQKPAAFADDAQQQEVKVGKVLRIASLVNLETRADVPAFSLFPTQGESGAWIVCVPHGESHEQHPEGDALHDEEIHIFASMARIVENHELYFTVHSCSACA